MKHSPTLIDDAIRESLRPHGRMSKVYSQLLAKARKFVLTPEMSSFLAEVASGPWIGNQQDRIEQFRHSARLPHALTWVEYDSIAYKAYLMKHHPDALKATLRPGEVSSLDDTIPRVGWLMEQHPKIETCFRCTFFMGGDFKAAASPFSALWCSDETPIVWPPLSLPTQETPAELLCGLGGYNSIQVAFGESPECDKLDSGETARLYARRIADQSISTIIREFVGELRRAWAFLATINDLPTRLEQVRASKGYVARGSYRRFVDHVVVHLTVPETVYRVKARQVLALAKRRAHMVRGFWRIYTWQAPKPCERLAHVWDANDNCQCGAWRTWIAEHQRGDAALGFVMHDYVVEHKPEDVAQ
jgi:hypothetical protein